LQSRRHDGHYRSQIACRQEYRQTTPKRVCPLLHHKTLRVGFALRSTGPKKPEAVGIKKSGWPIFGLQYAKIKTESQALKIEILAKLTANCSAKIWRHCIFSLDKIGGFP
jgi:hypothetical protein